MVFTCKIADSLSARFLRVRLSFFVSHDGPAENNRPPCKERGRGPFDSVAQNNNTSTCTNKNMYMLCTLTLAFIVLKLKQQKFWRGF